MSDQRGRSMTSDPSRYLRALLVANDATQAMQAAVERTRQVFDCDVSWTGLIDDDCLHMGASSGLSTPEMAATWRLEVGAGIGGRAALLARPHKSNDYQHDARRVPAKRLIDNEGIMTVLVVPVLAADRTLGVLYAASRTPHTWSDDEVSTLESISHYLGVRLKQLDVDGRLQAKAQAQHRRAEETTGALRSMAELVNRLTQCTQIESAMEATAAAVHATVELKDEHGGLLHAAGPRRHPEHTTLLSGDVDTDTGLTLSMSSAAVRHGPDAPAHSPGDPPDAQRDPTIRLAFDALRLQLLRLREREQTTEYLRGELLDQLLTARLVDTPSLTRRLTVMGMSGLTRGARALVIGTHDADGDVAPRFVADLHATFPHSLIGLRDGRLVALIDLSTPNATQLENRLTELLAREDTRQGPKDSFTIVGVGRSCSDLLEISMSYDEARAACEVGMSDDRHAQNRVLSARSLGIQGLASLPLAQIRTTVTDTFGPLLESDRHRGTHHLSTVRAYLANDRHLASTATDLRVHYNTVRNRIARIEELLSVDLSNVDDRFRVETALRMEAVLRALSRRRTDSVTT